MLQKIVALKLPVCVDLDHTLITCNTTSLLLKQKSFKIYKAFFYSWSFYKNRLSQQINWEDYAFPYREGLLAVLQEIFLKAIPLYLVTGADQVVADAVSKKLQIFSDQIGSCKETLLVGRKKADYLKKRFPEGFVYMGDSFRDLPVLNSATYGFVFTNSFLLKTYLRVHPIFSKKVDLVLEN